ncbi:hypothetical protein [Campylobacter sp. CS_ED2]|uniref:hypothetical protein n=1 Tax=Campylobacter sp. CS_ED2 TaxID=2984141 RepID=UPI0022E9FAC7|nr:hypothetical protein [Campylobacter sp. CS_ED2]
MQILRIRLICHCEFFANFASIIIARSESTKQSPLYCHCETANAVVAIANG